MQRKDFLIKNYSDLCELCVSAVNMDLDLSFCFRLTSNDVNHGKNNDPNPIHKMPVPREHLDMLGVRRCHVSAQAQDQDQHEQRQTHDHVTRMQADQRVEGGPKKICRDRQMILKDQPLPFQSGGAQERHREENGDQPPELKSPSISPSKSALSQHDCQAAG